MNRRPALAALMAAVSFCSVLQAQPVEPAGVRYAPTVTLAGSPLLLNGAGVRYKFIVKVYTAGLYLATRAQTPEAVFSTSGPKRLHVVMLRDIDGNELGKLFTRGMQDNAPKDQFSKSIPGMLRMSEIFSARRKLVAGDSFSVDWVPGTGTTVLVNGKPQGDPVKEPEFFSSMMHIWLGPNPADRLLKEALLGRPTASSGGSPGQQ